MSIRLGTLCAFLGAMGLATVELNADDVREGEDTRAKVTIEGHGFWGDRKLKRVFGLLHPKGDVSRTIDETTIEDASIMLLTTVNDDGYLQPEMLVLVKDLHGNSDILSCDLDNLLDLPASFEAHEVVFKVNRGLLYSYEAVDFSGLNSMKDFKAREFFMGEDYLIDLLSNRIYTPARLHQGMLNLEESLKRLGYMDVKVESREEDIKIEHTTGKVSVVIRVDEGRRYTVGASRTEINRGTGDERELSGVRRQEYEDQAFSKNWMQEYEQYLKQEELRKGYPDASVSAGYQELEPSVVRVDAKVESGNRYRVGDILFNGHERSKTPFLVRKIPLKSGDILDVLKAQEGRYSLAITGVFETSDVEFDEVEGRYVRDLRYELKELPPVDFSLMAGYGSYELLRGGVEVAFRNMWGIGHSSRLDLIQSFKSTKASYDYSVPNTFGTSVDSSAEFSGLRRQEPSFDREEYRGAVGVSDYFEAIQSDMAVQYAYELLDAQRAGFSNEFGVENAVSSNILLRIGHDRTDNPLYPQSGYKVSSSIEYATEALGGDVNYLRLKLAGGWYYKFPTSQVVHAGISHSFVVPFGSAEENLPFNKRFFPGGENTVRGYKQGEASPRDTNGDYIGTQSFVLANLEVEQPLTEDWAIVVFLDSIGIANEQTDYPADEVLSSVGIGIRYRTVLGPVRLEYGHNLNPRPGDSQGALHFSLGVPF